MQTNEVLDLTDQIEMLDGAIAYCEEIGDPAPRQRELRAKYQERLDFLKRNNSVGYSINIPGPSQQIDVLDRPKAGARAANQFGVFKVHAATPRQVAFLARLLTERRTDKIRDLEVLAAMVADRQISKKAASAAIDILLGSPEIEPEHDIYPDPRKVATPKQVGFIESLLRDRVIPTDPALAFVAERVQTGQQIERQDASALIEALKAAPRTPTPPPAPLEFGMYRKPDGTMFRVYPGRQRAGSILAKRLVMVPDSTPPEWVFEYAGAAHRFVKPEERMSLEEAQAFGQQFGVCCVCAALLTDPVSVQRGIGPVCASRV